MSLLEFKESDVEGIPREVSLKVLPDGWNKPILPGQYLHQSDFAKLQELKSFFDYQDITIPENVTFKIPESMNLEAARMYLYAINPSVFGITKEYILQHLDTAALIYQPYLYFGDVTPLNNLAKLLDNTGDDRLFWIYMGFDRNLLDVTIFDEEERKSGRSTGTLLKWNPKGKQYKKISERFRLSPNLQNSTPYIRKIKSDEYTFISPDPAGLIRPILNRNVYTFFDYLTSLPGVVVCGGFPGYCVNPKVTFVSLETEMNLAGRVRFANVGKIWHILQKYGYNELYMPDHENYHPVMIEFINQHNLAVNLNNKNYIIDYSFDGDIDVFLYRDVDKKNESDQDYVLGKTRSIIEAVPSFHINRNVKVSKNSISISINTFKMKIQIIKRLYTNIKEILLGFDLDASAIALKGNASKGYTFYTLPRFINAVTYGINVINPSRQSESFNYRLHKYIGKGYVPYVPGAVQESGHILRKMKYLDKYKNHFPQLVGAILNGGRFSAFGRSKDISDYDEESLKYVPVEKRSDMVQKINAQPYRPAFWDSNDIGERPAEYATFYDHVIGMGGDLDWTFKDAGSQITGSFNPTHYNYFGDVDQKQHPKNRLSSLLEAPLQQLSEEKYEEQVQEELLENNNDDDENYTEIRQALKSFNPSTLVSRAPSIQDYKEEKEGKGEEPITFGPRAASPRAASPRAASPRAASPRSLISLSQFPDFLGDQQTQALIFDSLSPLPAVRPLSPLPAVRPLSPLPTFRPLSPLPTFRPLSPLPDFLTGQQVQAQSLRYNQPVSTAPTFELKEQVQVERPSYAALLPTFDFNFEAAEQSVSPTLLPRIQPRSVSPVRGSLQQSLFEGFGDRTSRAASPLDLLGGPNPLAESQENFGE